MIVGGNALTERPSSYSEANYHDANEHGRSLRDWQLEYSQMSAGRFRSTLSQLHLNNLQIFRECTDRIVMKRGAFGSGSMVLSLPLAADGCGWSGGRQLPLAYGLLSDGSNPPEILTPKSLDVICVAFDRQWFALNAVERGYPDVARLVWRQAGLTVPAERLTKIRAFFVDMFVEVRRNEHIAHSHATLTALEDSVVTALLEALATASSVEFYSETRQKKIADQVRDYAVENAFEKPCIDELCRRADVSRRHLQNCFLQSYGMSALQLLTAIRMNAVRRELKYFASEQKPVSIGDVAANWGFWHWSRFSGEYRRFFGELPSDTLRSN